ncbi:MAG: agmatinase [Desulfobacteraceae bacterium]|nr:MAG: agmatinase [Desulfobacteraceae bacterium]
MSLFGAIPPEFANEEFAAAVVLPVPYDETSTWLKGADRGPEAVIAASANMELYDIETESEVYRRGIFTAAPVEEKRSPEAMVAAVRERVDGFLQRGKFVLTLGGEHSVSIGAIQAHAARFPQMSVLQLDAHADLREEYEGSPFNHACVMARAQEACPVVQVGIRSMEAGERDRLQPQNVFYAHTIVRRPDWIEAVIARLTPVCYITIDLDVFDPALMPSTGTPEPGGLSWYEVTGLLQAVCRQRRVIGGDVVELCPSAHNKAPDFLAAKLIYKLLSYRFEGR